MIELALILLVISVAILIASLAAMVVAIYFVRLYRKQIRHDGYCAGWEARGRDVDAELEQAFREGFAASRIARSEKPPRLTVIHGNREAPGASTPEAS